MIFSRCPRARGCQMLSSMTSSVRRWSPSSRSQRYFTMSIWGSYIQWEKFLFIKESKKTYSFANKPRKRERKVNNCSAYNLCICLLNINASCDAFITLLVDCPMRKSKARVDIDSCWNWWQISFSFRLHGLWNHIMHKWLLCSQTKATFCFESIHSITACVGAQSHSMSSKLSLWLCACGYWVNSSFYSKHKRN